MRAHKRNQWLGCGLDRRQARRARRRSARRVAWAEALMGERAPEFKLAPWQRDVLLAHAGPFRSTMVVTPRRTGRGLTANLARELANEGRGPDARPFWLNEWVREGES